MSVAGVSTIRCNDSLTATSHAPHWPHDVVLRQCVPLLHKCYTQFCQVTWEWGMIIQGTGTGNIAGHTI